MGRCKSLDSQKSFFSHTSQLSGARILCFSHPEFLGAHHRQWLQPIDCSIVQEFFSFLGALRAQRFTCGEPELLMTMTALFTGTCSISQHHECPSTPSHALTSPRSSLFSHFLPSCSLCTWHLLPDFCSFVNTPGAQHSLLFFPLLGLCLPRHRVATPPSSDPYPKVAFSVGRSSFQCCHPCPPLPVLISFPAYFVS